MADDETTDAERNIDPTFIAPTEESEEDSRPRLREEIALCLSGGGYRAMLFHAGGLCRLNEAGLLPEIACVSSVSGGSIIAAILAANWKKLAFSSNKVAGNLEEEIITPVRMLGVPHEKWTGG